jgi:sec-independent protein translocase protein TatB
MFGISFGELLLIALVALLVLGPERLPGAARTAGLWVGRLKRSFNTIKQEVEREIGADEIRRQLHNENILSLEREMKRSIQPPAATPPGPPGAAASPETIEAALHPEPNGDALSPPTAADTPATPESPRKP